MKEYKRHFLHKNKYSCVKYMRTMIVLTNWERELKSIEYSILIILESSQLTKRFEEAFDQAIKGHD
jgi:hypothetical protein